MYGINGINRIERFVLGFNLMPTKLKIYVEGKKEKCIEVVKEERLSYILKDLDLKKDQIYKIDLYYKTNNEYLKTELTNVYYFCRCTENIFLIMDKKNGLLKDMRKCKDFGIYSGYKKKIEILEVDDHIYEYIYRIYEKENLYEKTMFVGSKDNFDVNILANELLKSKYVYDIKNLSQQRCDDGYPKGYRKVVVEIDVIKRKGWIDYLKNLF